MVTARTIAAKEVRLRQIESLPAWRWGVAVTVQAALRQSITCNLVRALYMYTVHVTTYD